MYSYISGKLSEITPVHVTLDVNGIGFLIYIPAHVYAKLPQVGHEQRLFTSFIVRELSHTLYGFISSQERDLFESLMGVSGVGPKVALSLIGHLPIDQMNQAVMNQDVKMISKVPGIGKKTAERLIIEMRDKLPKEFSVDISAYALVPNKKSVQDAMSALINLGYHQSTAQKALHKTLEKHGDDADLAVLIKESLKHV